jgi:hypothetical protein
MYERRTKKMTDLFAALKTVLAGILFTGSKEELSVVQMALVYKIVDAIEKAAKTRKGELKPTLLAYAKANGEKTEKGHFQAMVDGHKIMDEIRQATEPKSDDFKELLGEKGIKVGDAYDTVKTLVYNPSKVQHLVETGKLKAADVDELRGESHALKVTLSKPAAKELKESLPPKGE